MQKSSRLILLVLIFLSLFALILSPNLSFAATSAGGFVPCGIDPETNPCQFCDLISVIQNVINFFITVLAAPVVTLLIAWAGIKLIVYAGSETERSKAKQLLWDAIIGFIIMLLAWTIVIMILNILVDDNVKSADSSWFKIQCIRGYSVGSFDLTTFQGGSLTFVVDQNHSDDFYITDRGSSATSKTYSDSQISSGISSTNGYRSLIESKLKDSGYSGAELKQMADRIQAIMTIESAGNTNAQSPKGAIGLLQVLPTTAQVIDKSLTGKNIDEVRTALLNPKTNISVGVDYFLQQYSLNKGDLDKTAAAYNGGPAANGPSRDCPGALRWQCPYDSGGCYNTSNTSCTPNRGYQETRNYVSNYNAVLGTLGK